MTHIIYIPGLGDRYDFVRKAGLKLWRRKNVKVSHFPVRWANPEETFKQKMVRLERLIKLYPDTNVVIVGESAGGAFAIASFRRFTQNISRVVTVCGMNYGTESVNPALYLKNPAFVDAMREADRVVGTLSADERSSMHIIYSSLDFTVRPKNSLIDGVSSKDLMIAGHIQAILAVLFLRHKLILK